MVFDTRLRAGELLGNKLLETSIGVDLVLGLSHGGVAVAKPVAAALKKPVEVLVIKKIGTPGDPELATGAWVPEGQPLDIQDKNILLVDDGAATGASMYEAIRWVRQHKAKDVIVALPVAPSDVVATLQTLVSKVIVLEAPEDFRAVGAYYKNFPQLTDKDVVQLLA